ncbi:MAG: hypothetical protein VCA18_01885, partial [Opitutales bacterium]
MKKRLTIGYFSENGFSIMVGNLIGISIISLGIGVAESTGAQEEAEELATEITIAARLPELTKNTK